jgi:hypothetical protein
MQPDYESAEEFAARHVIDGRRIVAQQRALIARLQAAGLPIQGAEQLLRSFESSLAILEEHARQLRIEL